MSTELMEQIKELPEECRERLELIAKGMLLLQKAQAEAQEAKRNDESVG